MGKSRQASNATSSAPNLRPKAMLALSLFVSSLASVVSLQPASTGRVVQNASSGQPVYAQVYHVGTDERIQTLNSFLFAGGAYHVGIEVYGREWGYGGGDSCQHTGVGYVEPKSDPSHTFYDTYLLCHTSYSESDVQDILRRLARRWPMCEYDLLTRNCVHFADELVKNLCGSTSGVKPWMGRLARIGATVVPFVSRIFEGSAASSEGSRSITAS